MARFTRADWRARPAKRIVPMALPARGVIVHHSVTGTANPLNTTRAIQHQHQSTQGWHDIAYQELVAANGDSIEGRGFRVQSGATGQPWDRTHLTVCAIGNYEVAPPPEALIAGLVSILAGAVRDGLLVADWTLTGHRDHNATACPGRFLHARLPAIRRMVGAATVPAPPATPAPPPEVPVFIAVLPALAHQHHLAYPDGTSRPVPPGALEGLRVVLPESTFPDAAAFLSLFPVRP